MRVSRSDRQTAAFVLKWTDLERLIASVADSLPDISIVASCSDKLNRTFSNVTELKKFRNAERSAITELTITAHAADFKQRLGFTLNSEHRNNVRLSIDAEESIAIGLNDLCNDFIVSVRPWYARVAKADWSFFIVGLYIVFQVSGILVILFKAKTIELRWPEGEIPTHVFIQGGVIGMLPFLLGGFANKLREKYFPTGVFAINDGENRHTNGEVIRQVIIAGFAVSIASSVALSWFI